MWGKPWDFELGDINVDPEYIRVWHGEKDAGTTIQMGIHIADKLKCRLVKIPGWLISSLIFIREGTYGII